MEEIEEVFRRSGFHRSPWETYGLWQRRLLREPGLAEASSALKEILALHYRLRYRSRAPTADERRQLRQMVTHWLRRWSSSDFGTQTRLGR
jgi:hypothetical protein